MGGQHLIQEESNKKEKGQILFFFSEDAHLLLPSDTGAPGPLGLWTPGLIRVVLSTLSLLHAIPQPALQPQSYCVCTGKSFSQDFKKDFIYF